jgi:quercetin dioxygenase-like cupin family protein
MIFKELFQKLETAENPAIQIVQKTDSSKVFAIAFKKGMILKEHKTDIPAQFLVIKGSVIYKEKYHQESLSLYDMKNIQPDVLHSVEAQEDSLCLLFKE